ncbi:MAG: dihydrofolate reductase [Muribaculaceae bacterium]
MSVTIIAAVARDGAIGIRGDMPFHISADLRRFKELTTGHPLVMGRKTFESLPGGALPGRRNLVVSRNWAWQAPGTERFDTIEDAISACGDAEIMIIGGGEIYRQAMPLADKLLLTVIDADVPDADTHFPAINPDEWAVTEKSSPQTDPRSGAGYRFVTYKRN